MSVFHALLATPPMLLEQHVSLVQMVIVQLKVVIVHCVSLDSLQRVVVFVPHVPLVWEIQQHY